MIQHDITIHPRIYKTVVTSYKYIISSNKKTQYHKLQNHLGYLNSMNFSPVPHETSAQQAPPPQRASAALWLPGGPQVGGRFTRKNPGEAMDDWLVV